MKHTLLLWLLLCSLVSHAQYEAAVHYLNPSIPFSVAADSLIALAKADPADTDEGGDVNALVRWKYFMEGRISNDVAAGADMYAPLSLALGGYMGSPGPCAGGGNWRCLGPFTSSYGKVSVASFDSGVAYQGRVNALWVNPYDTGIILAGADAGGVWRTDDGGQHWRNISDGNAIPGTMGVTQIAVDPLDTGIIYVSLGSISNQYTKSDGYNLGIAYSTNSGATWQQDTGFSNITGSGIIPPDPIPCLAYMPGTSHLFAIYENKVLYKASPTAAWQDISPACFAARKKCYYIDFTKQSPVRAVVGVTAWSAGTVDSSALWLYDPAGGGSWTDLQLVIPPYMGAAYHQPNDDYGPYMFSISSDDTAFIEFKARNAGLTSDVYLLMNTSLSAANLNMLNPAFGQNVQQFVVSPANSNVIYLAVYAVTGVGLFKSVNRGRSNDLHYITHNDGRCLYIQHADTNDIHDVVYFGTDGGVNKKRYEDSTAIGFVTPTNAHCISITGEGLGITEFYGFGNTDADENIMAGGAQDNGGFTYIKNRPEPWRNETAYAPAAAGGDGYESKMMRNGVNTAIGEVNSSTRPYPLYSTTFTGNNVHDTAINNPHSEGNVLSRPLYVDPNNEAYVGYQHVWKMPYGDTGWIRAFPAADPIEVGAAASNTVVDFYIDEQDSNNVYIAYYGAAGTNPTVSPSVGKLFHSWNATSGSPSWANITPPQVQWDRINSITIDPTNHRRIWMALGDVNSSDVGLSPAAMQRRVYYSNDSGNTWADVSAGLSALPVNKLLYRKGSNDEIYAGTDVGVYKWDTSTNSWGCFNNDMPTCIVMDMEMNYCAGKLRVATYGRGIWETPVADIVPVMTETVTGSLTLNGNQYETGSIDVANGATLTLLNDTLHMPKNGMIAIEPGGHLVIDHSEITNSCESCLWQGMEARGVSTDPQFPTSNQGWVQIKNGSTIAHAVIGISNDNESVGWGTSGGIIQCMDMTFLNCQASVVFEGYDNYIGATLCPNWSYFTNCTFLVDNNYKGNSIGYPMQQMVSLHNVEGIAFKGCQWLHRDNTSVYAGTGMGISAVNTGFTVSPLCPVPVSPYSYVPLCPHPGRSRFSGFIIGASIVQERGFGLTTSIDQADFDSCSIGEYVSAFDDVSTTLCKFNIGRGNTVDSISPGGCFQNIGILSQNAKQFRTEENTFMGKPNGYGGWENYGAVIGNGEAPYKQLYNNTFDSLTFGVYSIGNNYYSIDSVHAPFLTGLQILCNSFAVNNADIVLANDGGPYPQGIADQKAGKSTAGNTFSGSDTDIINLAFSHGIFYGFGPGGGEYPSIGAPYLNVFRVGPLASATCPSFLTNPITGVYPYTGTALNIAERNSMRMAYAAAKTTYTSTLATYNALIDQGSTSALIGIIDTSTVAGPLLSRLGGISPYVSGGALKALADIGILTKSQMKNTMLQNPDDLWEYDVINYINRLYHFTGADYDSLVSAGRLTTDRSKLEDTMSKAKATMGYNGSRLLMAFKSVWNPAFSVYDTTGMGLCNDSTSLYYLIDSNAYYAGLDSVDGWLQAMGGLWTNYERAGYYDFRGQHTIADSIFTGIASQVPVGDSIDSVIYADYTILRDVINGAEADDRDVYHLKSDELALLDHTSTPTLTINTADVMMWALPVFPGGGGLGGGLPPYPGILCKAIATIGARHAHGAGDSPDIPVSPIVDINSSGYNNRCSAYPNPASGVVTFSYNVQDGSSSVRILVTNILGEKVADMQPNGRAGNAYWDPAHEPAGVYIYTASDDKGVISKGKLVLVK